MTTPVGQIGLSDVNVELGFPATTSINMNQASVRTLAGVPSGAISMNNLRGKSNRVAISLTISSNTTNYDVYSNRGPSYNPGKSDVTVTINPGVTVYSTSTGSAAFSVPSSFNPADTVTIVNNGVIVGRGGNGGNGTSIPANATAGSSGGPGLYVQFPTTFQNNNRVAGGGGGGGGGKSGTTAFSKDTSYQVGGGGGGGGVASGSGGSGGSGQAGLNGNPGSPAPLTSGGAGGPGYTSPGPYGGNPPGAGAGGAGGAYGSSGSPGTGGGNSAPGGGPGAAVTGNPYITWNPTGTRSGPIS